MVWRVREWSWCEGVRRRRGGMECPRLKREQRRQMRGPVVKMGR